MFPGVQSHSKTQLCLQCYSFRHKNELQVCNKKMCVVIILVNTICTFDSFIQSLPKGKTSHAAVSTQTHFNIFKAEQTTSHLFNPESVFLLLKHFEPYTVTYRDNMQNFISLFTLAINILGNSPFIKYLDHDNSTFIKIPGLF